MNTYDINQIPSIICARIAELEQLVVELNDIAIAMKSEVDARDKHIEMLERHIKIAENALMRQDKWQKD